MIDKDIFAAGIATLAGAHGREVDGPVVRAYYTVLSPRLTTEQFERAVASSLASDRYWPSPAELLAKVEASVLDEGEQALRDLNRLLGDCGGYLYLRAEQFMALPLATREAVKAVGGLRELAMVSEERYPSLRRKFAEAYRRANDAAPALPAPSRELIDPMVRRITASIGNGGDVVDLRARAAGERDE